MRIHYPLMMLFALLSLSAQAQMEVDKAINLSGLGSDAKVSGIKSVSAAQDAVSAEVLQKGGLTYALASGTGSAYAISLAPAISAYTNGMAVHFKANVANTGPVTLNVNGTGAVAIKKNVSTDLVAGDIAAGQLVTVVYDGANFQLTSRGNSEGTVAGVTASSPLSATPGNNPNISLTGVVPITNGGTGTNSVPAAGQLLIGNGLGAYATNTITGTANQVTVANGAGTITLSTPQDIAASSTPSFARVTVTGANQNDIVSSSSIQVGNTSQSAAAAGAGSIRYASPNLEYSDGSTWKAVSSGAVTGVTASNGLTSSGGTTPNITLGGTLSGATSINMNGQNLNFTGSGNHGIGTASPGTVLEVAHNGASAWGTALLVNQNQVGNSDGPKLAFRKLLTNTPTEKTWSMGILNGVGNTSFAISENGGIGGFGTPQLVISAGGSVGIGTNGANPLTKLEVISGGYGIRSANPGSEPGLQLENTESSGRRWDIFVGSTNTYSAGTTYRGNLFIYDRTSESDRLVIGSNGNVGIGTPGPTQKLEVAGNMMAPFFYDRDNTGYYLDPSSHSNLNTIAGAGGTASDPYLQNVHAVGLLQHHDGNNGYSPATWHQCVLGDNGGWAGNHDRLYLRRADGSYGNEIRVRFADGFTSQRELKTNIVPIDNAMFKVYMDKLLNTQLYSYEFKNDPNHVKGLKYIGFIADEIPEEMQMPNKEGVKTGDTFAMMLAAIKVLKEENDELKARLNAIERQLEK